MNALNYGNTLGGNVTASDKYLLPESQGSLGVQLYQYVQNKISGYDEYDLRILGAANSRAPHTPTIKGYSAFFYNCNPGVDNFCSLSGITQQNQGAWFNFPGVFSFWGHNYKSIFVCSNGWAAFVYAGSTTNCNSSSWGQANPAPLPQADYQDSSGTYHDVPEGILAPLWKPLDPSAGKGQIIVYSVPVSTFFGCSYPVGVNCEFRVIWNNVMTTGESSQCGGKCLNSFSLDLFSNGTYNFGYHYVDPADPYNGHEIIGLDDPAGYFDTVPDRNTSVCGASPCPTGYTTSDHGVSFHDANYQIDYISDSKISLVTTGTGYATFLGPQTNDLSTLQGYNVVTSNPPPTPDYIPYILGPAEGLVLGAICTTGWGCVALTTGAPLIDSICNCVENLIKSLQPEVPPPPQFQVAQLCNGCGSGYLEAPVQESDQLCGRGTANSFNDCAVDTSLFDQVDWLVPNNDFASHSLQITYGVQAGATLDIPGTIWESTVVTLTIGPEGDFGISSCSPTMPYFICNSAGLSCSPVTLQVNGNPAHCNVIVTALNNFYGTVTLGATASAPTNSGFLACTGTACTGSSTPSTFALSKSAVAIADLVITPGSVAGVYTVTVTGNSGPSSAGVTRSHSVSITVNVADFTLSGSPLTVPPGSSAITTITAISNYGFAGSVTVTPAAPPSVLTITPSAATASVAAGGTGSANFTISADISISPGTSYTEQFTGSTSSVAHTFTLPISVNYLPLVVSISSSPSNEYVNQPETFTGSVSGGKSPYTYSWNFGDGSSGTGNPTTHTYTAVLSGQVTMTVTDARGVQAVASMPITVQPLGASFTYSPSSPLIGQAVTFTGSGLGGFSPYSYAWSLGRSGNPATYTFANSGTYTVTLTVTDAHGVTASSSQTVIVNPLPLTASFTYTPSSPASGQSVTFTASPSGGTQPYTFSWSFGDGTSNAAGNPVSHSYSASGCYSVTLTVTDSNGRSATSNGGIVVDGVSCGGSIAYGSLITLANGQMVPVQNLQVGAQMLGYDTATGKNTVSIVKSVTVVDTSNMLIIHTTAGTPFRGDANPHQTLWVKTPYGTVAWTPVTKIRPGDELYTSNGWVPVTSIEYAPSGTHLMYDIIATAPYFADRYLDPISKT